jgi:hypothetical protein
MAEAGRQNDALTPATPIIVTVQGQQVVSLRI